MQASGGEKGLHWEECECRALLQPPLISQELQLREAQNENARLADENSRLSGRATGKEQVATLHRAVPLGILLGPWSLVRGCLHPRTGLESEGYSSPW